MKALNILRSCFILGDFNTSISREAFEKHFTRTSEKVTFTFNGWDGKSYEGETRTASIYRVDIDAFADLRFIKVGKSIHCINDNYQKVEMAIGIAHPTTDWVIDVRKA